MLSYSDESIKKLGESLAELIWGYLSDGDNEYALSVSNFLITGENDGKTPIGIWTLKNCAGEIMEEKLFIR